MALKYDATQSTGLNQCRNITAFAPFDRRMVVESESDLYDKKTFQIGGDSNVWTYIGMMVTVAGTNDVFVLVKKPTSSRVDYATNIEWKKVGGADVNPSDFGARVVDSADELDELPFAYQGMFAVVKDNPDTSENEGGLYVLSELTPEKKWMKVTSSPSASSDTTHVITVDGTIPTSGSGISVSKDSEESYVQEDYIDKDGSLEAGKYYTSRGLNSTTSNGGDLDEDYILLSKGGESSIRLNSPESDYWMEIAFEDGDDSLGFTADDLRIVDENGIETIPVADEDGVIRIPKESPIKFVNGYDFNGMTESHPSDNTTYIFGEDGSTYDDLDIYSSTVLPTVIAYVDGTPVKVLTEGDKIEIINMIDESVEPESITTEEILGLFNEI